MPRSAIAFGDDDRVDQHRHDDAFGIVELGQLAQLGERLAPRREGIRKRLGPSDMPCHLPDSRLRHQDMPFAAGWKPSLPLGRSDSAQTAGERGSKLLRRAAPAICCPAGGRVEDNLARRFIVRLLNCCARPQPSTDTVFVSNEAGYVTPGRRRDGQDRGRARDRRRGRGAWSFSPDGKTFYVAASDAKRIEAWDVAFAQTRRHLQFGERPRALRAQPRRRHRSTSPTRTIAPSPSST